jgi:uncharacterized protein YdeI (YjbR/CyaY-like superfamily)
MKHPNETAPPMTGKVRAALDKHQLMDAYRARPSYQQHEYLKWIAAASGEVTRQKRLDQMIEELKDGGKFKGEPWTPPPPVQPASSTKS